VTASAPGPRSDVWQELIGLAAQDHGDRALLLGLLGSLRDALGLEGAALYVPGERGLERHAVVGGGDLPERLPEAGPEALPVGGARLLVAPRAAAVLPAGGPLLVALATCLEATRLRRRIQQQRFAVNYRAVELEALYEVGLAIASTLELDELADAVLLRAVSLLDARRGAFYLREDGCFVLARTLGGAAETLGEADPRLAALLAGSTGGCEGLLPGALHLLAVPIEAEGVARGLLVVGDKESRTGVGPFTDGDRRTLALFANQAAIALENARLHRQALEKERLERELDLAADIQRRLLPAELPDARGFEVLGWSRPARHVGGDYYDLYRLEPGKLAVVIADVAGKGMPAALLVSTLHSALRLLQDREQLGPDLVARLNRHVVEASGPNKFITLLLGEIDLESGRLVYVNAGHNPALLLRAGGALEELAPGGLPLGLFAPAVYRAQEAELAPGDLLCLFSDGITECESPEGAEFGAGRLGRLLRDRYADPLPELMRSVERAVTEFAAGGPQGDDQTVVLVRRQLF
jgi:sigma-B regulation protein RsbU (phosphoserine phosphatase)